MIIQKAQKTDLPAILELQKLCYRENAIRYNDFQIPPLVQTIEELENDFKKYVILKVEDEVGKIIGSIRAFEMDRVCYIERLIVHPENQNQGIGKRMMLEMEKQFDQAVKYELFTGFKDEKNIYFYSKLGYTIYMEESHGENLKFLFFEKTGKSSCSKKGD